MSTAMLHKDIDGYIRLMKYFLWWYGDFDYLTDSLLHRCFKAYMRIRWCLVLLLFIVTCIGLHSRESMGLFDGTFVYGPLTLHMTIMLTINSFSGQKQNNLAHSLNNNFLKHNEVWMNKIRKSYTVPLWRMVNYFVIYNISFAISFVVAPLIADTVLHFVFDSIEKPVALPLPLAPYYGDDYKWTARYYIVSMFNWWSIVELATIVTGPVLNFWLLSNFFLTEMRIFREKIQRLELERRSQDNIDKQMEDIIQAHNNLLVLNRDMKAAFGLPCAFNTSFVSIAITLCLFTALITNDLAVRVSYVGAMLINFSTGLIYCTLGQLLENESNEIFFAVCNLPWSKSKPKIRKDLNMIIRQARTPLIIDYHGRAKMNLTTFMQIMRSSYSYFTLLQSMAK